MVSSLLRMGIKSLDRLAVSGVPGRPPVSDRRHPLAAYPQLHSLLAEAERSGSLEAERRRLLSRRYSA